MELTLTPARRAALVLVAAAALAAPQLGAATVAQANPALPDSSVADDFGYRQYLSERQPTGYSVGWGTLYVDKSYDGSPLSLLVEGREQTFDRGIWAHGPSTITYNDIQEYGYERLEAWVGIGDSARASGKSAEVVFKVVGDGQTLWQSGTMTERSDAEFVSVDISDVRVLQLVVETTNKASHPHNHAIWADAALYKAEATPWLSASDKEFANPEQVTAANILEGVFARTLSGPVGETDGPVTGSDGTLRNGKEGNDLSDAVTYTTDYVEGETGDFAITYRVRDAQGFERSRTVRMTVLGDEIYRTNADVDYLTTPFASYLYAGRDYFDEQGKAAFDLCVETLLGFGRDVSRYPVVSHWGERVYRVSVDLQGAGIFMTASDAAYLTSTIMDCEPRTFHVKDWGTGVSTVNGLAGTVTFYVPERYGQIDESGQTYYHRRLLQAEENASRFLSSLDGSADQMTDAQRLRAVLYPYADWISYGGGGQVMDEALAGGMAVCGGNARGGIYLSQRMGIKAYWVRTDSHAWSNVKLNDDDSLRSGGAYYRIDLLARPGCFLSVDAEHEGFHGHHKEIYFNRMKGYPDMTAEGYPFAWTAWPGVTLDVEDSWVVLAPEDKATFDARSLIASATSIYDGSLLDEVEIDYGYLYSNAVGDAFAEGYYELMYSVTDTHGNSGTATVNVQVVGGDVVRANAENCTKNVNSTFLPDGGGSLASLWNGSGEVTYGYGIAQNDGGKSVTYSATLPDGKRLTYLDAWVGLHKSTRDSPYGMNGKVRFLVKATVETDGGTEEVALYTSPDMTRYTVQQHVLVAIPDNAVTVTLTSESIGNGNGHARWGNPRFFTTDVLDEVPVAPSVSNVENGATYDGAVTPQVSDANSVTLYRTGLPVAIDPSSGAATLADAAGTTTSGWGEPVEGYQAGEAIEEEGVYALVAENAYRKTIVRFTIKKDLVRVADPTGVEGLTYSASGQVGVAAGKGYSLSSPSSGAGIDASGNAVATTVGTYTVIATPVAGHVWLDGTTGGKTISWAVLPATLTATYTGESVAIGQAPAYSVEVTGFVGTETADSAAGYQAPSIAEGDRPASLEAGARYVLTPTGGSADNYRFEYVPGSLAVGFASAERPVAVSGLVANGTAQVGIPAGEGYALVAASEGAWIDDSGNAVASEAGTYVASAHPVDGHSWADGTFDPIDIEWTVAPASSSGGGVPGGDTNPGVPGGGPGSGDGSVGGLGDDVSSTPGGTTATVVRDEGGRVVSVDVSVGAADAAAGAVTLPTPGIAPADAASALPITVETPSGAAVAVTVPVSGDPSGAVLVMVGADGTETVMPKTWLTESGLTLNVSGQATLKVVSAGISFPDVSGDEWYAKEVVPFVSARGILTGSVLPDGRVEFRGDESLSRAMLVTMLHRLELEPAPSTGADFTDVPAGSWFSESAAWGKETGVVAGYEDGTGRFGGDDPVTREQVALFCYRYAKLVGIDTSARTDLSTFSDGGNTSDWASEAMSWAVATGLLRGDGNSSTLRPDDGASRAESATIVMRLIGLIYA